MSKVLLIIVGYIVILAVSTVLLMEFLVSLHDFLDRHGIQDKRCREVDRELGCPQKKPSWKDLSNEDNNQKGNMTKIEQLEDSILINGRYRMYQDGVVYDTLAAQDIPQWIFIFRDFVKENMHDY